MSSSVMNSMCHGFPIRILASIACLGTLVLQASILNYYLVVAYGVKHWAWWVADAVIFGIFVAAFVVSFRSMKVVSEKNEQRAMNNQSPIVPGELPLGYVAWICYSVVLAVRLWLIFWEVAQTLNETDFFGPNTLKFTVGLCCIVFLLLVSTHHDAEHSSTRESFIKQVVSGITFDLLDTIAILEVLFIQDSHVFLSFALHRTILVIACLNVTLPTLPLLVLSKTRYGRRNLTKMFHVVHHLIYLLLINVPLFVVRIVLWHVKHTNISIFIIKNIINIALSIKALMSEFTAANEELDQRDSGATELSMMPARPQPGPDFERETDPAFSEAATLPIRHRSGDTTTETRPRHLWEALRGDDMVDNLQDFKH